ncbi:PaaI family thioesterase [uncultured Cocleimonas sp.]|uniref:PaaI family thioesterase n=1 Tax=uncultured Cocleimonas sp. TaxID=1051587 RepID=UPI002627F3F0|nr:PaaI family thioesterase [uncultured Cocleimonas sp.]
MSKQPSKITLDNFNSLLAEGLPWAAETGIILESVYDGFATMRLPYHDKSTRPGGTISGPHMMMLSDACMYAVVLSMIGEVQLAVTTNFNINFLRKPSESDLIAEGEIIKLGKRLAILEVSIYSSSDNEIVAHSTGTYSIPPTTR